VRRESSLQCAVYLTLAHRPFRLHGSKEAGLIHEPEVHPEEIAAGDELAIADAPTLASSAASEYAHELVDVLVDRQASDVVLLDLSRLAAFADFFIVATSDNIRQARALVDAVDECATLHDENARIEGSADEGWILVDAGNGVIVHVFSVEARVYYNLEGLWRRAQEIVRIQ
jgi:ribosome-associated protein